MENLNISNVKINIDILSFESSKLNISIQNMGESLLPGYFYSFRILLDNIAITDMQPKLSILENTNLYTISNNLKYLNSNGVGDFVISNLMKPDKIYYHSIDLGVFNINLKNKINIEDDKNYKFKEITFSSWEYETLFKNEILTNYNIYSRLPKSNTLVLVKNISNNNPSRSTITLNNDSSSNIITSKENTIQSKSVSVADVTPLSNGQLSVSGSDISDSNLSHYQTTTDSNESKYQTIGNNATISTGQQSSDPCSESIMAGVSCDPHILTFGGNRLELPEILDTYNLLTKSDLVINGETGSYNDEIIMKNIFVDYENNKFVINLETLEFKDAMNMFLVERIGIKTLEIYTYDKKYKFFANSEKFGFIIELNNVTQDDSFGIFMSNSFEDCKINSIINSDLKANKYMRINGINQLNVSSKLKYSGPKYHNSYFDNYDSVLFWGMYDLEDLDKCANHKGKKYIYWHRNDTITNNNHIVRNLKKVKKIKNVIHLHSDKATEKNLQEVGIISKPL